MGGARPSGAGGRARPRGRRGSQRHGLAGGGGRGPEEGNGAAMAAAARARVAHLLRQLQRAA